jgi:hypothetical protein
MTSQSSDANAAAGFKGSAFHRVVLLDFLNPDLTFTVFARKLEILKGALTFAFAFVFFFVRARYEDGWTPAAVAIYAYTMELVLTQFLPYVAAVATGTVSDAAISVQRWGFLVGAMMVAIVIPAYPIGPLVTGGAFMSSLCDTPLLAPYHVVTAIAFFHGAYNNVALMTGEPPLCVEGYARPQLSRDMTNQATCFALLIPSMIAVGMAATLNRKQLEESNAAAELSRKVAALLGNYDTDGVLAALDEYSAMECADSKLIESYMTLVSNLDAYRPHLPQWMIEPAEPEDADELISRTAAAPENPVGGAGDADVNDLSSIDMEATASLSRHRTAAAPDNPIQPVSVGGAGDADGNDLSSIDMEPPPPPPRTGSQRGSASTEGSASPLPPHRAAARTSAVLGQSSRMNTSMNTSINRANNSVAMFGAVTRVPHIGHVAFALVGVRLAAADTTGLPLSRFADRVHTMAAATYGAVHCCVGDTVQLSWNAATKATQPEVKAARFLCRLRAATSDDAALQVSGAAMAGPATTQWAGTGKVQALSVSLPWHGTLKACLALASQLGVFLVDGAIAAEARGVCKMRAADALQGHVRGAPVLIHEVVAERADDNDEWMYVLERQGEDPAAAALAHCIAGRYADAIATLDKLGEARGNQGVSGAPVTALIRLRDRAERALATECTVFALPPRECYPQLQCQ